MKSVRLLFIAALLALVSGCSNLPGESKLQSILSAALPPGFSGDAEVHHKNPWISLDAKFYGLKQDPASGKWSWRAFEYKRGGRFSDGSIMLTPDKDAITN